MSGANTMKLSVIIPCYNEAPTIAQVVSHVAAAPLPNGWEREIIVVDDGSGEETLEVLRTLPTEAQVLYRSHNSGKGAAVKDGLREATGDYCVIQDADLELDPSEFPVLLAPLLAGRAQAVFGYRTLRGDERYSRLLFWGGKCISLLYDALFFKDYRDLPCCYKVFPRRIIPALLSAPSEDFVFDAVELTHVISSHCTVAQVPVTYKPRSRAEGKKIRARHGLFSAFAILFIRLGLHRGPVQQEFKRMSRYVITGSMTVAVDLFALWALTELFGLWYVLSAAAAFAISYAANFTLHKYWTFKSLDHASMRRELPLHLGLACINLGLNTLLVYILVEWTGLYYLAAQVLVAGFIALESFVLLSRVIFKHKQPIR